MSFKDILLGVFFVGTVTGTVLAIRANKEIDRIVAAADSARVVSEKRHMERTRESQELQDSIEALSKQSSAHGRRADDLRKSSVQTRVQLAKASNTVDSLHLALRLADTLEVEVQSLRARRLSDSLQILILTVDRDRWKEDADTLLRDLISQNEYTHGVAVVAKRKVNLGFISIPTEVATGVLGLASGYGIAKLTN